MDTLTVYKSLIISPMIIASIWFSNDFIKAWYYLDSSSSSVIKDTLNPANRSQVNS